VAGPANDNGKSSVLSEYAERKSEMEPTGDGDGSEGDRAGEVGGTKACLGAGAATGRRGMLLGVGPVSLGGTGGSGEFGGLAIAAMLLSPFRALSVALGGGTGGSGISGSGRGGALSGTNGARSSCDSNSKVGRAGKEGGAGRAFEKRERPDLGGSRVAAPIMSGGAIVVL